MCQKMLSSKCIYKSYIFKQDLALNNLQGLISHKTQTNKADKCKNIDCVFCAFYLNIVI